MTEREMEPRRWTLLVDWCEVDVVSGPSLPFERRAEEVPVIEAAAYDALKAEVERAWKCAEALHEAYREQAYCPCCDEFRGDELAAHQATCMWSADFVQRAREGR